MEGERCKHQISGQLSKVLQVSQGLCGAAEWGKGGGGMEEVNTQGEATSSSSSASHHPLVTTEGTKGRGLPHSGMAP